MEKPKPVRDVREIKNKIEQNRNKAMLKNRRSHIRVCCAPNCTNNAKSHKGISFHHFPNATVNRKIREVWITRLNRTGGPHGPWVPMKSDVVCGVHFNESGQKRFNDIIPRFFHHKTYPPTSLEYRIMLTQPDAFNTYEEEKSLNNDENIMVYDLYEYQNLLCQQATTNPVAVGEEKSSSNDENLMMYNSVENLDLLCQPVSSNTFNEEKSSNSDENKSTNQEVNPDHTYSLLFTEHHNCALTITRLRAKIDKMSELMEVGKQSRLVAIIENAELKKRLQKKDDLLAAQHLEMMKLRREVILSKQNKLQEFRSEWTDHYDTKAFYSGFREECEKLAHFLDSVKTPEV